MSETYCVASLGSIGKRHAENLRRLRPGARIVGLRATNGDPGKTACDLFVSSIEEALTHSPRAAIIASPASLHRDTAEGFLTAGVPVLVEKPLADTLAAAERIAAAAKSAAVPAMVGYNLRFSPIFAKAKAAFEAGEIGDVPHARFSVGQYLPDWRPTQDYRKTVSARADLGGGALLELSHEIDLACWFFGLPDRVYAEGGQLSALEIDVEDVVELTLRYENPARIVTVGLDFLARAPRRQILLTGADATLSADGIAQSVRIERGGGSQPETSSFAPLDPNAAYMAEMTHFLDCVENGGSPSPSVENGLDVMRIVEAARRSMKDGRAIAMKDLPR